MSSLLHLKTSLFDGNATAGVSSQLSAELIAGLRMVESALQVHTRDFSTQPVPYFDGSHLQALITAAEDRSPEQQRQVAYSDKLIAELQSADQLVIGVPMYNFAIPAMLKSWTDHVARAGVTFRYTDNGPVGLLTPKKVYLILARGGIHDEGVTDLIRPHMRIMLQFMGLHDIEFIVADGLNMGDEAKARGMEQARAQIRHLLTKAGLRRKQEQAA